MLAALENPLAERLEACSTISLSLEQFEPMDMTLDRPLTPLECESSFHSIVVAFERECKTAQFCNALHLGFAEPCIQTFSLSLSQHRRKVLNQFICLSNLRISLAQLSQILLLPV